MSDIFDELLSWSEGLAGWQRDAMRRLALQDDLTESDFEELMEIAASGSDGEAIDASHLPSRRAVQDPVQLTKVRHVSGVNRLAEGACLDLQPDGLSVIFGMNGVGKSGYTRILKRSCQAKLPEPIIGNVFESSPKLPVAELSYKRGGAEHTVSVDLRALGSNADLRRVPVFDHRSGARHLDRTGSTLSFVPAGFELLHRYIAFLDQMKAFIRTKCDALTSGEGTYVSTQFVDAELKDVVDGLGEEAALKRLNELATLDENEASELESLPDRISEINSSTPAARATAERLRTSAIQRLAQQVREAISILSPEHLSELNSHESRIANLTAARDALEPKDWSGEAINGVGTAEWHTLWDAAAEFAAEHDPHEHPFPQGSTHCVLCQQPLTNEASDRLASYADAAGTDFDAQIERLQAAHDEITSKLDALLVSGLDLDVMSGLASTDDETAAGVSTISRTVSVLLEHHNLDDPELDRGGLVEPDTLQAKVIEVADELDKAVATHRAEAGRLASLDSDADDVAAHVERLQHLKERKLAESKIEALRLEHKVRVERKHLNSLEQRCGTTSASQKARDLNATHTAGLEAAFTRNLDAFSLDRSRVKMRTLRIQKGSPQMGIELEEATGTDLIDVLSDGEFRAVSLAAFLADLEVAGDRSAIILDDPVTSLDHRYQEAVAARLIQEARHRQVIVFTHSTAFVGILSEAQELDGKENGGASVPLDFREINWSGGAGVTLDAPGTPHAKLKDRLALIENHLIPAATKLYKEHQDADYARAVTAILDHLRKAWERGVEEVAINGIVMRYRHGVQTQQLKSLLVLTSDDCDAVDVGMSVESRYVHDGAIGGERMAPTPEKLREEVKNLREWADSIRKRR